MAYAREEFPFDKGLDCLDAQGAINEDVLSAIKDWLRENPNAQFLCIGCHGDEKGLYPVHTWSSSFAAMTWSGEGDDDRTMEATRCSMLFVPLVKDETRRLRQRC